MPRPGVREGAGAADAAGAGDEHAGAVEAEPGGVALRAASDGGLDRHRCGPHASLDKSYFRRSNLARWTSHVNTNSVTLRKLLSLFERCWATLSPGGPMTPRIRPRTPDELVGRRARALRRHHRRPARPGTAALRADRERTARCADRSTPCSCRPPSVGAHAGARRRHPLPHALHDRARGDRDPARRRPTGTARSSASRTRRSRAPSGSRRRSSPRSAQERVTAFSGDERARRAASSSPCWTATSTTSLWDEASATLSASRPCSSSPRSSATTRRSRCSCGSSASRRDVARAELPRYGFTL